MLKRTDPSAATYSGSAPPPPDRPHDDWRAMQTLGLYRFGVALALFALFVSGRAGTVFDLRWPGLFGLICICYLLHCLPAALLLIRRWPGLQGLVQIFAAIDIALVVGLMLATAGAGEGLGILLVAPIAATGLLLSQRLTVLNAAVASLAVILAEFARALMQTQANPEYTQAGLLGALFFIVALTANVLAQRARSSAALAEVRKGELDDLATLNDRIVQQVQVGLMVLDEDLRVRMLNRAARQMLQLGPDAVGRRLMAASAPLGWALEAWQLSPTLPPEPMGTGASKILPRFSYLGRDNSPPVLVFLEDARRVSEQAQQMKLASLGRLTASIAHEIRNPLSAISHASQLLGESEALDTADRRLLDIVHRHSGRIDEIIKAVLGLSRRGDTYPMLINLKEWLPAIVNDYQEGRRNPVSINSPQLPADWEVMVDPNHLRQILYNLWDNADRHARVDGRELQITLRANVLDDLPVLDIADNGPGIQGKAAENAMEPFFTTKTDGTGLGLYIVQGLCECNFVNIELLSPEHKQPGQGACFRLTFQKASVPGVASVPLEARA